MSTRSVTAEETTVHTGSAAAAILSAGIGSIAVAIFAIAADKSASLKNLFSIYKSTGALSGETTAAVVLWLVTWIIFAAIWRKRSVPLARINLIAFTLLALSLLLTFPPIGDLL